MALIQTTRSPCGHAVIYTCFHAGEFSVSLHHHKNLTPKRVGYCQDPAEAFEIVKEFQRVPLEQPKEWELVP